MNTPADLGGEDFEPLLPEKTSGPLLGLRYRRCNRQVESRVQRDRFIDDPQFALELFELTAHPFEASPQSDLVVGLGAVGQKLSQRGLHDSRSGRAFLFGGCFKLGEKLFRELHANFLFHGWTSSELDGAIGASRLLALLSLDPSNDTSRRTLWPFASRRPNVSRNDSKRSRPFV